MTRLRGVVRSPRKPTFERLIGGGFWNARLHRISSEPSSKPRSHSLRRCRSRVRIIPWRRFQEFAARFCARTGITSATRSTTPTGPWSSVPCEMAHEATGPHSIEARVGSHAACGLKPEPAGVTRRAASLVAADPSPARTGRSGSHLESSGAPVLEASEIRHLAPWLMITLRH